MIDRLRRFRDDLVADAGALEEHARACDAKREPLDALTRAPVRYCRRSWTWSPRSPRFAP